MMSASAPSSTAPLTKAPGFAMTSLLPAEPRIALREPSTSAPLFRVIVTRPGVSGVNIPYLPVTLPVTEMLVPPLPR